MRAPKACKRLPSVGMIALAMVVFGLALAAGGSAQTLPKLPADFRFPAKGSPGPVLFSHRTHVNPEQANCTTCHPGLFSILRPGTPANGLAMSHQQMQEGKACGACHNGKAAFAPTQGDKCMTCHRAVAS